MKKAFFIFVLFSLTLFAQAEYVPSEHNIYSFLKRMQTLHLINGYDDYHKPITRSDVAKYLTAISTNKNKLDAYDNHLLSYYLIEFKYDINQSADGYQGLFNSTGYNMLSEYPKFIYFYANTDTGSVFVNVYLNSSSLSTNKVGDKYPSIIENVGGIFRGTFFNHFGYYLEGSNGKVFTNKSAALTLRELRYNFKLNEKPDESFYDDTRGHLSLDFDNIKFKIGRDRQIVGYGINKPILDDFSPKYDYASLSLKFGKFSFNYFHGKLLGEKTFHSDSITGGVHKIDEKFIGYHRIGFDVSRDFQFGFGELIIYSNRSADLSYINPFNFYKSVEHSSQDRDNSLMFIDAANNSIPGTKLYSSLILDDIDYSKLNSGWWGNQFIFQIGASFYNFYQILPIDFHIEYFRIEPYVFTHRLPSNNYTNYGFELGPDIQPNSGRFSLLINYRFTSKIRTSVAFDYTVHGANPIDINGNVIRNVGGDINFGHRATDATQAEFLDGQKEIFRNFSFIINYELFSGIIINLVGAYTHDNLQLNKIEKYWNMHLSLNLTM